MDEDVQAGGDQDRGHEAEQEHQHQVVHQERFGGYPKIWTRLIYSSIILCYWGRCFTQSEY